MVRELSISADSPILEELLEKAKAAGLPIEAILDGASGTAKSPKMSE